MYVLCDIETAPNIIRTVIKQKMYYYKRILMSPVIHIQGSGRAADILAFAYANSREEEVKVTDNFGKVHQK